MNNIVSFPSNANTTTMVQNSVTKKNLAKKVAMFFVEVVMIVANPFLSLALHLLNKVSTLLIVSSVLMTVVFYQTSGVTKYFYMALAYLAVSVLIKMLCNKKGR
ncbi:hypothetical protein E0D81_22145 [Lelliottia amnigena]|uniref:hypothetical protein n=1 Tax=Lelliottia amnigena TaxID=61646 RepID=UPI0010403138|nr:hypothetical protein [Lelliottia amnigena]TCD10932.1 hypothetical protein E0D81_22145 [Lelliottia amnigena]